MATSRPSRARAAGRPSTSCLIATTGGGNKLKAVSDSGNNSAGGFVDGAALSTEYSYDANGNTCPPTGVMVEDKNKGITSITYNRMNLPEEITFSDGNQIKFFYDAAGTKLRKETYSGGTLGVSTDYVGGFVYTDTTLSFFSFAEGRVRKVNNAFRYEYDYTDHLGNVRATFTNNSGSAQLLQADSYYPFGLKMPGLGYVRAGNDENKFTYNGKELEDEFNLNWYHYGVRYYDPVVGRWWSVDPAEEYQTPFTYVGNNPVNLIDPDGTFSEIPTPEEAANIAEHIYFGKVGDELDGGWILRYVYPKNEKNPGFRAGVYSREIDGVTEYTLATAGTYPELTKRGLDSIQENFSQPRGKSDHMILSLDIATELNEYFGKTIELTFVGHSKGGAEAAGNALLTNRNAIIFNPAAIFSSKYGLNYNKYTGSMTAFVVKGDPLHGLLNSWLAKPIDKLIFLPKQSDDPIVNHSMSGVKSALKEYNQNN